MDAIEYVQLVITLIFLAFVGVVAGFVIHFSNLEFNRFWKSRIIFISSSFVWILSLLFGRDQLWNLTTGLFPIQESHYRGLCQAHIILSYGLSQPLFFLTVLFLVRLQSRNVDLSYVTSPNGGILYWTLIWCGPMIAVHVLIVGLNYSHSISEQYPLFWTTFDTTNSLCVVPIISTLAFAVFYTIFLIFYLFWSNKFAGTLVNRRLRKRVQWSQFFFVIFFPFEVLLRVVLIFITKYQVATNVLSHVFFFIDLIICVAGVLEFALLPTVEAADYPLLADISSVFSIESGPTDDQKKSTEKSKSNKSKGMILENFNVQEEM